MQFRDHYSREFVPTDRAENVRWRIKVLESCARDASLRRYIWNACCEDILFWVNTFCFVHEPRSSGDKTCPAVTYPFQNELIREIVEAFGVHDLANIKSRDSTATWSFLIAVKWLTQFHRGTSVALASKTEKDVDNGEAAGSLFHKLDFMERGENMPGWLLPRRVRTELKWANPQLASSIVGLSTTTNTGVSRRDTVLCIDELDLIPDAKHILAVTADVSEGRILTSTPRTMFGAMYDIHLNAHFPKVYTHWSLHPEHYRGLYTTVENVKRGTYYDQHREWKFPLPESWKETMRAWFANPRIIVTDRATKHPRSDDRLTSQIAVLDPDYEFPDDYAFVIDGKLRSVYYDRRCRKALSDREIARELDISFEGSGDSVLDASEIHKIVDSHAREPDLRGELLTPDYRVGRDTSEFVESFSGHLELWFKPGATGAPQDDRPFVLGVDIGVGVGVTPSVISVWDARLGRKVGVYKNAKIKANRLADMAFRLGRWFAGKGQREAFLVFDSQGPTGRTFWEALRETGYSNLYMRKSRDRLGDQESDKPGYGMTDETKVPLLENYWRALLDREAINPSKAGVLECLAYELQSNGTYQHSGALRSDDAAGSTRNHGDECIADALGWLGVCEVSGGDEQRERKKAMHIPPGSVGYAVEEEEEEEVTDVRIGAFPW